MALTVKHLNGDASFLLSFEPVPRTRASHPPPRPFRVLLDPWIIGPSMIFHSKISTTTHKEAACVSSLQELPEPDLVIISQHKSDHCNEATLKQLPASGTKTIILAEPNSARTIRSWKYFDKDKVRTIPKWGDPHGSTRECLVRVPVPPQVEGGEPGEITVAYIPQRRDISGLHAAIGITYRPPPTPASSSETISGKMASRSRTSLLSPPTSPRLRKSYGNLPTIFSGWTASREQSATSDLAPSSPISPGLSSPISPGLSSLRSVRSASSIPFSIASDTTSGTALTAYTYIAPILGNTLLSPALGGQDRTLSILFSPHGISYSSLHSYAASHLAAEAALPLTALMHCFDNVSNPWWLGGNILLGAPAGTETAGRLGARAWISAHDGDKEVRGLATGLLRTRKWHRDEIVGGLNASQLALDPAAKSEPDRLPRSPADPADRVTEALSLGTGEEVILTCDGVWNAARKERDEGDASDKAAAGPDAHQTRSEPATVSEKPGPWSLPPHMTQTAFVVEEEEENARPGLSRLNLVSAMSS